MHKTEGANHTNNLFTDIPPSTIVEQNWLNAVQNELRNVIEGSGLVLKTAATETGNQLLDAIISLGSGGFPSPTTMLFAQSVAPVGWTKKTNWQDQSMIVYTTGNIAQGGSVDAKAAHQHGAFTLAEAEMPVHTHGIKVWTDTGSGTYEPRYARTDTLRDTAVSNSTGGGGSHQHTANSAPYYLSVISAVKD